MKKSSRQRKLKRQKKNTQFSKSTHHSPKVLLDHQPKLDHHTKSDHNTQPKGGLNANMALPMWQWLILGFFLMIISAVLTQQWVTKSSKNQHHLYQLAQQNQQSTSFKKVQQNAQQQLFVLKVKSGELQAKVEQLDMMSKQLASIAGIPEQEFENVSSEFFAGDFIDSTDDLALLLTDINELTATVSQKEFQLKLLESAVTRHHIEKDSVVSGLPIAQGWLSSYYGMRLDPFTKQPTMHRGMDFAGKLGSDVIATGSGVITWADQRFGYGRMIEIDHGNGIVTRYGHNQKLLVKSGDLVAKGQVIAKMGSSGRSTGPHVHYEVLRRGSQVNPLSYVRRK